MHGSKEQVARRKNDLKGMQRDAMSSLVQGYHHTTLCDLLIGVCYDP